MLESSNQERSKNHQLLMRDKAINDDKFRILLMSIERKLRKLAYLLWLCILKSELLAQVFAAASSSAHC